MTRLIECGGVAQRERRRGCDAVFGDERCRVYHGTDRGDADGGNATTPAFCRRGGQRAVLVRGDSEPDSSDEVTGDGDQWQQQVLGPDWQGWTRA